MATGNFKPMTPRKTWPLRRNRVRHFGAPSLALAALLAPLGMGTPALARTQDNKGPVDLTAQAQGAAPARTVPARPVQPAPTPAPVPAPTPSTVPGNGPGAALAIPTPPPALPEVDIGLQKRDADLPQRGFHVLSREFPFAAHVLEHTLQFFGQIIEHDEPLVFACLRTAAFRGSVGTHCDV